MAIEKVINIKVNESGIDEVNKDLGNLDKNLNKVKTESEKTSTGLKDVGDNGGAIAVLDSLTGGLATRIRDTAEASKLLNFSLKGTRTALIATGIGAFVVALGLVVAYWEDIKNFISGSNVELERQLDLTQELGDAQQRELDILDKQDNVLKLQGKTQKEINALKKEELNDVIAIREEELILAKERLQQLQDIKKAGGSSLESFARGATNLLSAIGTAVDKLFGKLGFDTNFGSAATGITDSMLESIFGTDGDIDEAEARVKELEDVILNSQNRLAGIILSEKPEQDKIKSVGLGLTKEEQDAELLKLSTQFEQVFGIKKMQEDALVQLGKDALEQISNDKDIANAEQTEKDRIWSEKRAKIAEIEAQAKTQALEFYGQALGEISGLVGKETAAGKAFAVASTLISTYLAAQQAYASQLAIPTVDAPIRAALAAGVAVASGLANVKAILSVKTPAGGGALSNNAGGGGGGGASAPSFNVVGNSGVSQIGQTLNQEQEPVQAFVVGNAVTSQQALDRDIVDTATLG